MNILKNIKISYQILVAFSLIIFVIAALGVYSIVTVRTLDHDFNEFAEHVHALEAVGQISRNFSNIQLLSKEYIEHSNDDNLRKINIAHDEILKLIDKKISILHIKEEIEKLKEVRKLVEEYWEGFKKLSKDRREQKKVIDIELHKTGDKLQEKITLVYKHLRKKELQTQTINTQIDIIQDAVVHLLIARDHTNRFIYSGDEKEVKYALSEMARVRKDITAKEMETLDAEDQALLKDAIVQLDKYKKAMQHFIKLDLDVVRLQRDVMDKATDVILKDLKDIEKIATAAEKKIAKHVHEQVSTAVVTATISVLAAIAFALILSLGLGRMISRPVRELSNAMKRIAEGDLDTEIPQEKRKDEIGEMLDALKIFQENMIKRHEIQRQQEESDRLKIRRQEEVNQLVGIFGNTIKGVFEKVGRASNEISEKAAELKDVANSTSEQASLLNRDAGETASSVTTASSAAEELTASIGEIQSQADHSAAMTKDAMKKTENTSNKFTELLNATQQITSVVDLISEIAEQTNLLALNATIEAARAGEAGRGFAVVASEVKDLATQTAKATGDISEQVGNVQEMTKHAEDALSQINETIKEISEVGSSIAESVRQQQFATSEIAQSLDIVSSGAASVGQSVEVVLDSSNKNSSSAEGVKGQADLVSKESKELGEEVEIFLGALKSNDTGDKFQAFDVNLRAEFIIDEQVIDTTISKISAVSATLGCTTSLKPGSTARLRIDGLKDVLSVRIASNDASSTIVQFPLTLDHIEEMRKQVALLSVKAA